MFLDLLKIRLYHGDKNGSLLDKLGFILYEYRTFWRFSIVGVSNTIVDYGLFYLLTRLAGLSYLTANPISVETAIIWSFIWNNLWTFKSDEIKGIFNVLKKFLQFNFTSLGALLIQTILGTVGVYFLGPDKRQLILPFIIVFVVLPYNYLMYTKVIWKKK